MAWVTRLDGPAVEREVAGDLVKKVRWLGPVLLVAGAIGWQVDGVLSVAYALALVVGNFWLAATMLAAAARISLGLLMAVALTGYVVRLGLIAAAVLAVRNLAWVELVPLSLTLIVAHLGLLIWETKYVSASLAFPGLKPERKN